VARPVNKRDLSEVAALLAAARVRIAVLAGDIAATEEGVADTLERMAEERPEHAKRLLAKAAHARRFAAEERARAELA
jgi:hypothetical protein